MFSVQVNSLPRITEKKVWLGNWQQGLMTSSQTRQCRAASINPD